MMTRKMYWGLVTLIVLFIAGMCYMLAGQYAEVREYEREAAAAKQLLAARKNQKQASGSIGVDVADDTYQPPPLGETDDTGYWEGNTWHQKPAPKPKKKGFWSEDPDTLAHRIIRGVEIKNPERFQLAQRIIREYPHSEAALKMRYAFMHYGENGYRRASTLSEEAAVEYAVESYKDMLKYHPNSSRVLTDLAWVLEKESPEEAIAFGQKSLRIDPSNRETHQALAHAYQYLGDYKTALVHLKAGQKLSDPGEYRGVEIIIDENTSLYSDYDEFTYEISMIEAGTPRYGPAPQPSISSSVDIPMFPSDAVPTPPPDPSFDPLSVLSDMPASVDEHVAESAGSPSLRESAAEMARAEHARHQREEFEGFLQWMEQIERAKSPADLEDFLMREMATQLQGGTSAFTPERLIRAFETQYKHGGVQGLHELQRLDPELAKEMTRYRNKPPQRNRGVRK